MIGHRAVLLPPQHVRRYRTRNKADRADAKALLEAFRNEEIRPVPVKTPAQQTLAYVEDAERRPSRSRTGSRAVPEPRRRRE